MQRCLTCCVPSSTAKRTHWLLVRNHKTKYSFLKEKLQDSTRHARSLPNTNTTTDDTRLRHDTLHLTRVSRREKILILDKYKKIKALLFPYITHPSAYNKEQHSQMLLIKYRDQNTAEANGSKKVSPPFRRSRAFESRR